MSVCIFIPSYLSYLIFCIFFFNFPSIFFVLLTLWITPIHLTVFPQVFHLYIPHVASLMNDWMILCDTYNKKKAKKKKGKQNKKANKIRWVLLFFFHPNKRGSMVFSFFYFFITQFFFYLRLTLQYQFFYDLFHQNISPDFLKN